jgi:hypothetical protein
MRTMLRGICPACQTDSLYVESGGTVTCELLDCPDPGLLDRILRDADLLEIMRAVEARKWRGRPS